MILWLFFLKSKQDPHFPYVPVLTINEQVGHCMMYDTNPQTNALPSGKQT